MSWDAIGALAELIGALGVIASLVYLASQIRQNNKSLISQRYDERTRALREINISNMNADWIWHVISKLQLALGTEESLFAADYSVEKWQSAFATLDPIEKQRYELSNRTLWNHYQNMYYQYHQGFLELELYQHSMRFVDRIAPCWIALGIGRLGDSEFEEYIRKAAKRGGGA